MRYTRALFGKPPDEAWLEELLTKLSLWDKRDAKVQELSGGMMRRVLIAKALSHRPQVLFLDEPTAGVDVELRKGMWDIVRDLRAGGTTIILTTHYIEEAEAMADRIAVINGGRILLVEEKATLMRRMGRKHMTIELQCPVETHPRRRSPPTSLARVNGGAGASSTPTTPRRSAPASPRCCATSRPPASCSRTCRPGRTRSRTSSSAWCGRGHELARHLGDLPQRDGADLPHHRCRASSRR